MSGSAAEVGIIARHEIQPTFAKSSGLRSIDAAELLKQYGKNELEEKIVPSWLVYLQQLYQPMPIVIWLAIIIEGVIEDWVDFALLLLIQFVNATLAWYETTKAGNAVAALKASLKPKATVKRDGIWQTLDASIIVPGDLVLIGSGSSVPADCVVNHGQVDIDQSALTGESRPVTMKEGDCAKMGSTCVRGEVEATVKFTGKDTFFGKTAALLQAGTGMSNLQRLLLTITVILLVLVGLLVIAIFIYLLEEGESLTEALSFCVVLTVACTPLAIEIVTTTTLAIGSRAMAKMGAIVSRLAAIEDLAGMNMLCCDKTGTLTLNQMVVQDETPTFVPDLDQAKLLVYAALAARWREPPRDALDTLVLSTANLDECDKYEQLDYMPFDPQIKRTEGTLRSSDGVVFKTTKGAPHVLMQLVKNADTIARVEELVCSYSSRGVRCLAVAKTDEQDEWQLLGLITFLDPPRLDTKSTLERAMQYGVSIKMITGDHTLIARETMRMLGLGDEVLEPSALPDMEMSSGGGSNGGSSVARDLGSRYGDIIKRADGFAQVFPQHKFLIVESLRQAGFKVGMTGDGVNDAPALKRSDVGIAVQGATDAARASADIVLTEPGLSVIVEGLIIARAIFQRMSNFLTYRVASSLQLLLFFFIAAFSLHPSNYHDAFEGQYVFQIPVLMLMLITLLTDGVLITVSYDNVVPSQMPDRWNLWVTFTVAIVHALVACGSSLLLLWACVDSGYGSTSLFFSMDLPAPVNYGQIVVMLYMKISITNFLTLFSARTHAKFFWSSPPSAPLLLGALASLAITTLLACVWPDTITEEVPTHGLAFGDYTLWPLWIWIYCVIWFLIQDVIKVCVYLVMHRYNIFNIKNLPTDAASDALQRATVEVSVALPGSSDVEKGTGAVAASRQVAGTKVNVLSRLVEPLTRRMRGSRRAGAESLLDPALHAPSDAPGITAAEVQMHEFAMRPHI